MRSIRDALVTSRLARLAKEPLRGLFGRLGYEIIPARIELDAMLSGLVARRNISTLIDVGANEGQYALDFRRRGFLGEILSFEPMADAFHRLEQRAAKDSNWQVRQLALGGANGQAGLNISANSVSSSLLQVQPAHLRAEPSSRRTRLEWVPVRRLDDEFNPTQSCRAWLKLDVQGFESSVLAGATDTLKISQVVQCELSLQSLYEGQSHYLEILSTLESSGFTPVAFLPGFADGVTAEFLQVDVISRRSN